jgi:transcriptional regulator GlxA family with amidase domain
MDASVCVDKGVVPWQRLAEMPNDPHIPPRRIVFLSFPDVQLLDITGPLQVFSSANRLAERVVYETSVVSAGGGAVASSAGLALVTGAMRAETRTPDTVIVPGGAGVDAAARDPGLRDWVRGGAATARRMASVCTGAFLLAASGVLSGRRATTHWSRCAELAAAYPEIQVETDAIHVIDGPIWTSAGVTAGIDMALAMLEADLGRAVATAVARHLVVFARRPGGQAQFSSAWEFAGVQDRFDDLHAWMRAHLRDDLSVPALARQAGMSERSFLRHYRQVTGTTPSRVVERLRVEAARQALGATALPMKRVARDCGFGSEETMRRGFLRILAVPPGAYRERFPV